MNSDYFQRIQEALEGSEIAYDNGDMEEAVQYLEELRDTATEFLEELERVQAEDEED